MDLEDIKRMSENTLAETLGIEVTKCEKGHVTAKMPVDHRHHQPMGLLHGGVSVALAETAASIGGSLLVYQNGKVVVGQEINANHIKSIKTGTVRAEAHVIHQGKTSQVWETKIYNDETGDLICISRCTLAVITPRP